MSKKAPKAYFYEQPWTKFFWCVLVCCSISYFCVCLSPQKWHAKCQPNIAEDLCFFASLAHEGLLSPMSIWGWSVLDVRPSLQLTVFAVSPLPFAVTHLKIEIKHGWKARCGNKLGFFCRIAKVYLSEISINIPGPGAFFRQHRDTQNAQCRHSLSSWYWIPHVCFYDNHVKLIQLHLKLQILPNLEHLAAKQQLVFLPNRWTAVPRLRK